MGMTTISQLAKAGVDQDELVSDQQEGEAKRLRDIKTTPVTVAPSTGVYTKTEPIPPVNAPPVKANEVQKVDQASTVPSAMAYRNFAPQGAPA